MAKKDYYDILGVSKTASVEEIKQAYRRMAQKHHPDKGGGKEAEARFKEINEAYQVLGDAGKRASYDQFGSAEGPQFGGGTGGFGFGARDFDFSQGFGFTGGIGDIFEGLFSQAMSQVQAEVEISIPQAVLGDTLHFQMDGKPIEFSIPPGTQDGSQFHLRGKGRSFRGGVGDLIIVTRVRVPKRLNREQRVLYEQLKGLG